MQAVGSIVDSQVVLLSFDHKSPFGHSIGNASNNCSKVGMFTDVPWPKQNVTFQQEGKKSWMANWEDAPKQRGPRRSSLRLSGSRAQNLIQLISWKTSGWETQEHQTGIERTDFAEVVGRNVVEGKFHPSLPFPIYTSVMIQSSILETAMNSLMWKLLHLPQQSEQIRTHACSFSSLCWSKLVFGCPMRFVLRVEANKNYIRKRWVLGLFSNWNICTDYLILYVLLHTNVLFYIISKTKCKVPVSLLWTNQAAIQGGTPGERECCLHLVHPSQGHKAPGGVWADPGEISGNALLRRAKSYYTQARYAAEEIHLLPNGCLSSRTLLKKKKGMVRGKDSWGSGSIVFNKGCSMESPWPGLSIWRQSGQAGWSGSFPLMTIRPSWRVHRHPSTPCIVLGCLVHKDSI